MEPSKFRIFLCIVFTELGHFHFLLTEWHDGVVIDKFDGNVLRFPEFN